MTYRLLAGLRVIESSAFIAAPLAGLTLAQFGADVIRVDMIGGGIDYERMPRMPSGRSLYWTGLNKGKRSVAIDLRRPEGRELVQALATAADTATTEGGVLLTNIGMPWNAHAVLAKRRPDVITCTIQGNPDGGTAVDYTVHCATGFPAITGGGTPERPVNQAMPAWDIATAYHAAFSIAAAVDHRRRTGEGADMRLALSDMAFAMLSHLGMLGEAQVLGRQRESIGNYLYGAFGRDFGTGDGRRVMIIAISDGQWRALLNACGIAGEVRELERSTGLDFSDEAQRYQARESIAALVEPWFAARPYADVARVLDEHRVCWGPYRTTLEAVRDDPRASVSNPLFERIDTPGVGAHIAAGAAVRIEGSHRDAIRPAPLLGADTDAVLHDVLGLAAGEIGRLHDASIVAGPERDPFAP